MEFPWGLFLFHNGTFLYGEKSVKLTMGKKKTRLNVVQ